MKPVWEPNNAPDECPEWRAEIGPWAMYVRVYESDSVEWCAELNGADGKWGFPSGNGRDLEKAKDEAVAAVHSYLERLVHAAGGEVVWSSYDEA